MSIAATDNALTADIDYATPVDYRPAFDFQNGSRTTLVLDKIATPLVNARTLAEPPTLDREGIQVVRHETSITLDDPIAELTPRYFAEMCAFLQAFTGADLVIPQGMRGLMIRRPPVDDRPFYLQMQGTRIAHLDFTQLSFDKWRSYAIAQSGLDIDARDYRRILCMQTWRMMVPGPQNETLGLMDARSYTRRDGVVLDSIISDDDSETFEIVGIKQTPRHRWLFWPDLTPEEPILFKGWDTDPNYPVDVPHQAITNPLAGPNPRVRESVESRFYCFFK